MEPGQTLCMMRPTRSPQPLKVGRQLVSREAHVCGTLPIEPDAALNRPRSLTRDQVVTSDLPVRPEGFGEGYTIPVRGDLPSHQLDQRGSPIEVIVKCGLHTSTVRDSGPTDQQRHSTYRVVRRLVVSPYIEFALRFRMVSADHDHRVLENSDPFQRTQQLTDPEIGIPDTRVVPINRKCSAFPRGVV